MLRQRCPHVNTAQVLIIACTLPPYTPCLPRTCCAPPSPLPAHSRQFGEPQQASAAAAAVLSSHCKLNSKSSNSELLALLGLPRGVLALLQPAGKRGSAPIIRINGRKVEVQDVLREFVQATVSGGRRLAGPWCRLVTVAAGCSQQGRQAGRQGGRLAGRQAMWQTGWLSAQVLRFGLRTCFPPAPSLVQRLLLLCSLVDAAAKQQTVLSLGLELAVADGQDPADGLLLTWALVKGRLQVEADGGAQHSWLAQQAAQHYSTAVKRLGAGMPANSMPFLAHLAHTLERQDQLRMQLEAQVQQAVGSQDASRVESMLKAMRNSLAAAVAYEGLHGDPMPPTVWEEAVRQAQQAQQAQQQAQQQGQQQQEINIALLARAVVTHARLVHTCAGSGSEGEAEAEA